MKRLTKAGDWMGGLPLPRGVGDDGRGEGAFGRRPFSNNRRSQEPAAERSGNKIGLNGSFRPPSPSPLSTNRSRGRESALTFGWIRLSRCAPWWEHAPTHVGGYRFRGFKARNRHRGTLSPKERAGGRGKEPPPPPRRAGEDRGWFGCAADAFPHPFWNVPARRLRSGRPIP